MLVSCPTVATRQGKKHGNNTFLATHSALLLNQQLLIPSTTTFAVYFHVSYKGARNQHIAHHEGAA